MGFVGVHLKTQRTEQPAVDIKPDEVGIGGMVGWHNVSCERILRD